MGALALFGEKYGDDVRVVEVGEYSRELCGGTHVARSGQLGLIKVLGESSIGAGVRRVEGLVGMDAFRFLATESLLVSQLSEQLKARPEELPERVSGLVTRLRDAQRELEQLRSTQLLASGPDLASSAEDVAGVNLIAQQLPDGTPGRRDTQARAGRPRAAAGRPARGGRACRRSRTTGRWSWSPSTRPDGARAWPRAGWPGSRPRHSAAAAGGKDDVAQGGGAPTQPDRAAGGSRVPSTLFVPL